MHLYDDFLGYLSKPMCLLIVGECPPLACAHLSLGNYPSLLSLPLLYSLPLPSDLVRPNGKDIF